MSEKSETPSLVLRVGDRMEIFSEASVEKMAPEFEPADSKD